MADARKLINAHAYSETRSTPLNAHISIHAACAPTFRLHDWIEWQGRLLDRVARWLRRAGGPVAYLWVREVAPRKGPHVHVLLHLHDYARRRGPLGEFIARTAFGDAADLSPPNAPVVVSGGSYGMQTRAMRCGALRYCLKSLPAAAAHRERGDDGRYRVRPVAEALGVRSVDAPPLEGLRAAASRGIGAAARHAAGWREMTALDDLRRYLNP